MNAPAHPEPAILGAGIHRLPSAVYHSDPAPLPSLSATIAKVLNKQTPLHAWHACRRLNPDWTPVNSKAFDIGTAAHRAVLGVGEEYIAIPDNVLSIDGKATTSAAKLFVAEARDQGLTPIKQSEITQIEAMRTVAADRLAERNIKLDPACSELAALAQIDDVWCRAMFDNVPPDPALPIYDYKTIEDASPDACLKSILNYGYDVQAEHYRAVWQAVTGENRRFVFIFQEKVAPYEVTLIGLSGSFRDIGQTRAARARRLWGECLKSNRWPGYAPGLHEVDPPVWLIDRVLQENM